MTLGKVVRFVGKYSIVPLCSWVERRFKFKIAIMETERLGHLSCNNHLFFIRQKNGALKGLNFLLISPSKNSNKVANAYLLKMFVDYSKKVANVRIICSSFLYFCITFFKSEFKSHNLLFDMTMESNEDEFSLGKETISLSEKEKKYGESILDRMPIPKNRKIVSIFSRDSSYLSNKYPKEDWTYHSYRDSNIETYVKAIKFLISKNYVVLRIGSEYSEKLDYDHENYFEYSLSEFKSDFMDLYVSYISEFIIGTRSGATDISLLFNTPLLDINSAPLMLSPVGMNNIFIQKKLVNLSGEIIPYKDIISDSRYYLFDGNKLENTYGIKYLDNTSEEIVDATIEMHNNLTGNLEIDPNQRKLLDRYHNEYCQKNNWSNRFAPISINWLEKNYSLYLNDDEDYIGDRNVDAK